MAKQAEIEYLEKTGPAGQWHAFNKPFSDPDCGHHLLDIGAVLSVLPPPPARLLDLGCGTGWTSCLFARRGYDVLGQDIAPGMIRLAEANKARHDLDNLDFEVSDYEDLPYDEQFDCAVFMSSLHHAVDEHAALRAAYQALKVGGLCVVCEPGIGHARQAHSLEAVRRFGVTEKDMPPGRIIQAASLAGFRKWSVYTRASRLGARLYAPTDGLRQRLTRLAYSLYFLTLGRARDGMVVLVK